MDLGSTINLEDGTKYGVLYTFLIGINYVEPGKEACACIYSDSHL